MSEQTLFKTFCDAVRDKKLDLDAEKIALIRIANARYRFAKFFAGVQSTKYTESTLRGYSESMRVFLAYTALEMMDMATLEKGESDKSRYKEEKNKIVGKEPLLSQLRDYLNQPFDENKTPLEKFKVALDSETLKTELTNFAQGKNDNLTFLAYAIRVMVAHGTLTPSGTKILSKKNAKLYQKIAELLLEKSQEIFERYLAGILENQK